MGTYLELEVVHLHVHLEDLYMWKSGVLCLTESMGVNMLSYCTLVS